MIGFKSFKDKNGRWRWIAWAASSFEDLEGEFFKTKALGKYVAEAYKKGDHGKLWFYHLPVPLGDGDFTALVDRILLKMGTWADDPIAQKAANYFSQNGDDWGASVGYNYRRADRKDKVYEWVWIFETSPVPADKAAFPYSRFDILGGEKMTLTEDQRAKLEEVFGDEWQNVLSMVEKASKQLAESGLAYKAIPPEEEPGGPDDITPETAALVAEILAGLTVEDPEAQAVILALVETLEERAGEAKECDKEEYWRRRRRKKSAGGSLLQFLGGPLAETTDEHYARLDEYEGSKAVSGPTEGSTLDVVSRGTPFRTDLRSKQKVKRTYRLTENGLIRSDIAEVQRFKSLLASLDDTTSKPHDQRGLLGANSPLASPLSITGSQLEEWREQQEVEQAERQKAINDLVREHGGRYSYLTCAKCGFSLPLHSSHHNGMYPDCPHCHISSMTPTTTAGDLQSARASKGIF